MKKKSFIDKFNFAIGIILLIGALIFGIGGAFFGYSFNQEQLMAGAIAGIGALGIILVGGIK